MNLLRKVAVALVMLAVVAGLVIGLVVSPPQTAAAGRRGFWNLTQTSAGPAFTVKYPLPIWEVSVPQGDQLIVNGSGIFLLCSNGHYANTTITGGLLRWRC